MDEDSFLHWHRAHCLHCCPFLTLLILQQLMDEVEVEAEHLESEGCGQLQQCTAVALEGLAASVLAVEALPSEASEGRITSVVTQLLASVASCGDAVSQSVAALVGGGVTSAGGSMAALGVLQAMEKLPEAAGQAEVSVVPLLMEMALDLSATFEQREAASAALFTAFVRIGRPIVSMECTQAFYCRIAGEIYNPFVSVSGHANLLRYACSELIGNGCLCRGRAVAGGCLRTSVCFTMC